MHALYIKNKNKRLIKMISFACVEEIEKTGAAISKVYKEGDAFDGGKSDADADREDAVYKYHRKNKDYFDNLTKTQGRYSLLTRIKFKHYGLPFLYDDIDLFPSKISQSTNQTTDDFVPSKKRKTLSVSFSTEEKDDDEKDFNSNFYKKRHEFMVPFSYIPVDFNDEEKDDDDKDFECHDEN